MGELKKYLSTYWLESTILFFGAYLIFTNHFINILRPDGLLKVDVLNIGQGDSIYIESPSGASMLIDSGPDESVLSELDRVKNYFDRKIDVIMITNPDKDHIFGFIDVIKKYKPQILIEPGTKTSSNIYSEVKRTSVFNSMDDMIIKKGDIINLGGGVIFTTLFPDRDVSGLSTNDGSIIGLLTYGSSSMMFTGDAPIGTLDYVSDYLANKRNGIKADILKAGHHGSRTSASEKLVNFLNPNYIVISAGKNNSYGHPHKEALDIYNNSGAKVIGTYEKGTILFKSNGAFFKLEST